MAASPTTPGRSRNMAAIRSKGNASTELRLRARLREGGLAGWRRHRALPGKPDFVWARERVAVFVDGCFWHGCPRCYAMPRRNTEYWRAKVRRNRARDREVRATLRALGWRVHRIWECQVMWGRTLDRIRHALARHADSAR